MNRSERRAPLQPAFSPNRCYYQPGHALGLGLGLEIELAWLDYCDKSGPETDDLWDGVMSEVPAIAPDHSDSRWS